MFRQAAAGDTNPPVGRLTLTSPVTAGDDLFLIASGNGYTSAASVVTSVGDSVNGAWRRVLDSGSQYGGHSDYNSVAIYELVGSRAAPRGLTILVHGRWGQSGISSAAIDVGARQAPARVRSLAFDRRIRSGVPGAAWASPRLSDVRANDVVLGLFGGFCHAGDVFSAPPGWHTAASYWWTGQGCVALDWEQPQIAGSRAAQIDGPGEYHHSAGVDLQP